MLLVGLAASYTGVCAQKQFTIVIDAGHGGKDPGAKGAYSFEKNINLAVVQKLGEKIEKQNEDVKVLYTRKTDKYLTVAERPEFANKAKADLFISVHTNSSTAAAASGVETFSLGVAKTKENLEVAMMENSVILLESDYKQKYQGFDPKSVESYIMFEFMQDAHSNQSIHLASLVQNRFINSCNRKDRGVRQAGFLVLKNTAMPAILVELGFISNAEEERYLNSKEGQEALADAIYAAFVDFKTEFDKKSAPPPPANNSSTAKNNAAPATKVEEDTTEETAAETYAKGQKVYKVQILTEKKLLKSNNPRFKGLQNIGYYQENGVYKYTYGETADKNEAAKLMKEARKNFNGAFIITFIDGKRQK
ncbi:N-acetylmuramoyl-L-alanine amidase [Bacteroidia bacterium]|nr:N-acetylmuramoyl-L-alanine amidase [Bacteroidia bacterium]